MMTTMAKDNLTAVLHGIDDLRMQQRPIPTIKDNEVLIEIDCVGICGSDVHYLTHGRIGDFVMRKPMVIGHEAAGIVVKVGAAVKTLKMGDRVAIEPGVPCHICEHCKGGKYNICPEMAFCATPPIDGNLTRFYAHAADYCYKLPDHMTMEEGTLLEPLAVGVHACRRAGVQAGAEVLILGAGPIGLAALLAAKAMGATNITITNRKADRLKVAKTLGANHIVLVDDMMSEADTVRHIHKLTGKAPDMTIDCSGAEATARLAILATRSGGVVVLVGLGCGDAKLPLTNGLTREVDIRGVFRYCNDYPAALALASSGKVDLKPLITHHFDITKTADAFKTSRHRLGNAIKVIIHCTPRNKNNPKPLL